jgi:hypothetical protein|tara:strand:+ start:92 stop:460 length:369 start_codon:yes stop_codon:yes gene_type:complete
MANTNLTEASCSVVLDLGLWAGTRDGSTSWLNGIAGVSSGDAENGLKLLVVDLVQASTAACEFDITDTGITGVSGTRILAFLGATNPGTSPALATDYELNSTTSISWTAAAADTVRMTVLYA